MGRAGALLLTCGPVLGVTPVAARDGMRVTVERERSERGAAEQIRLGSASAGVRLWGLLRREEGGREWVRWSADGARGRDRWILGGTRGWTGGSRRGWADALAARDGREAPRPTVAAAPVGATWVRDGGSVGWVLGGGRGFDGGADGAALLRAGSWSGGAEWERGRASGVACWSRDGAAAVAADLAASAREARVRLGLGGGRRHAGLVVDGRVRRGGHAEWIGRAAVRSGGPTRLRVGVDVRLRGGKARSEGKVEWEPRTEAGTVHLWTRQPSGGAPGRAGVDLTTRGRAAAGIGLELGGPRNRRRASFSLSGRAGAARIAFRLDARSGSGRRASISVGTPGARGSWRAYVDWRRGAETRLRLAWSGATGGGN